MALSFEDLELLLRAWGRAYGIERLALLDERRARGALGGYGDHPIARGLAFAPGKKRADLRVIPRDGFERRQFMARGLEAAGISVVPFWACDPVPDTETRTAGVPYHDRMEVSPELRRVQTASLELQRFDSLRGAVLRIEYCDVGKQKAKAERLADKLGVPLKLRRYRDELDHARTWMHARLA